MIGSLVVVAAVVAGCAAQLSGPGDFLFAPGHRQFNHGSYGSIPAAVLAHQRALQDETEVQPDIWFRWTIEPLIDDARYRMAEFLAVEADDLVLVENASAAVNTVMRSLSYEPGDLIVTLSTVYPMVQATAAYIVERYGATYAEAPLEFPLESREVIAESLSATIEAAGGGRARLCIFSHISSVPAIVEPLDLLIPICHRAGALVLVDAAHAVGNLDLNVTEIGADFYLSNFHKWFFAPRGAAFLHATRAAQRDLVPTVISRETDLPFAGRFGYTGTRDSTPFATVLAALEYRAKLGGEAAIRAYNRDLIEYAGPMLAARLGTEMAAPLDLFSNNMVDVRLPTDSYDAAVDLVETLLETKNMYLNHYPLQGRQWCRLSAQVFLSRADFDDLADAIAEILGV